MPTNNILNNTSVAKNFSSPNFISGYSTTATANSTTTITVASNELQYFTGSTTQTVVLPVASTLVLGQSYTIVNNSTGLVTVQSSGANTIQAMAGGYQLIATCILTSGTTAASWAIEYTPISGIPSILGGAANDVVYQTAASTTGFIADANNSVMTTLAGNPPALSSYVTAGNIKTDSTTTKAACNIAAVGSVVAAGSGAQGITSFVISGTQYISVVNQGANTVGTYSWNGSKFVIVGTALSVTSGVQYITSYQISGTQYITITNNSTNNMYTYSWNGSAFVSIGAAVAAGTGDQYIISYVISGTQYITVSDGSGSAAATFSWNGSNFVSIGTAITTGANPLGSAVYTIGSTYYLSIACYSSNFYTFSWNGTNWVSIGSAVAQGANGVGLAAFAINGKSYLAIVLSNNQLAIFSWNGSAYTSFGTFGTGTNPQFVVAYVIDGVQYLSVANYNTSNVSTWYWTGTTFSALTTVSQSGATNEYGITTCLIGSTQYFVTANAGSNNISVFSISGNIIEATGTFTGGLSTAPVASSTATAAFVTSLTAGTSVQNTTGYDLLVNIVWTIASATTATLTLGVGPATGPTTNTVFPSFTTATSITNSYIAVVPNNYYLVVNSTGTISVTSITAQASPL